MKTTANQWFTDADGAEWIRNADGTFRCLSAEIRSMPLAEVRAEFGPLSCDPVVCRTEDCAGDPEVGEQRCPDCLNPLFT